jgi:RNA polymerase sigma-70 factor (ECF subfamily)
MPVPDELSPLAAAHARELAASRYGQMAFLLALHLTGRREDARDIAQEAMLRFFAHQATLHNREDARPWLLTTVRNLARDLWRRQRVRPTDSIDAATFVRELRAPDAGPEETLQRRQAQERVWRAMAALPSEKREILVLRDFHDLSYADIARVLSIPAGTVMSRLHAARTALRTLLSGRTTHA